MFTRLINRFFKKTIEESQKQTTNRLAELYVDTDADTILKNCNARIFGIWDKKEQQS